MKTNHEVAKEWMEGKDSHNRHMYSLGNTIYSYGPHYPIARKVGDRVIFNADKSTITTNTKHKPVVRRVLTDFTYVPGYAMLYPDEKINSILELLG